MRFGPVPVEACAGGILAHGVRTPDGVLKKGRVLDAADAQALADAGHREVVVARLDAGDVSEDEAAAALAAALAGAGVRTGKAFTGRCNLFADRDGLMVVDAGGVDAMNAVDEAMTVATLGPFARVSAGQLLGTVKVIPFAVPGDDLARARALLEAAAPAVRVAEFRPRDVTLVQTRLPGTKEAVLDKTAAVTARRLEALGSRIAAETRCAHDAPDLADALNDALAGGAGMVLVVGASAIVDRRDVVPAAIEAAGGRVDYFGMPVDPGNLLLLGQHGPVPVLGLPGCARSPKHNGFDWVLERLLAGIPVAGADIAAMGVGGLLKETHERAQPRIVPGGDTRSGRPRVAALVLAAGQSRRMGRRNKLLEPVDGIPMVLRAVDAALAGVDAGVYVVTGHERDAVVAALAGRDVRLVHNPRYAEGLSTSLAAGIAALGDEADAVLVCLGDMPRVTRAHVRRLVEAFDPLEGRAICVPLWNGKRGHPVLWARRFFPEMEDIRGDVGARHLLGEHADQVYEVPVDDDGVLLDVDSPDALEALRARG